MAGRTLEVARRWLIAAAWVYFTILFAWAAAYFATGDGHGLIALINSLAIFLFVPLPLVLPLAAWARRGELWCGLAAGAAIALWLWGGLFWPRPVRAQAGGAALTVMTYNVLGLQRQVAPAIDVIRRENADVVFLQEVNSALAALIQTELADDYPYQHLDPRDDVTGMGTISKHPIHPAAASLPLTWVGTPQVLAIEWNGQSITAVNFHMWPSGFGTPAAIAHNHRAREAQALALSDFARAAAVGSPVIAAGDANATDLSDAYRILTAGLTDSWREAGFGFGHTFPGSDVPGSSRPRPFGWPVPQWLVRIDYVFHSSHWEAAEARLAAFDGVSDHRGVVVRLLPAGESFQQTP